MISKLKYRVYYNNKELNCIIGTLIDHAKVCIILLSNIDDLLAVIGNWN